MSTFLQNPQVWILVQVALAMLMGALIGIEREMADKPAGLRTHMLVAGAAALFVAIGSNVVLYFSQPIDDPLLRTDPIRIIEAVITGISFLGAGTIIRHSGEDIEGLTTAASILVAAGVGVAVAVNLWIVAVGVTVLALVTLRIVYRLGRWLARKTRSAEDAARS